MAEKNINKLFGILLIFGLMSTITIGSSLLLYVIGHDEIMYNIYDVGIELDIDSEYINAIESMVTEYKQLPQYIDNFFLISLVAFVVGFLYMCYFTNPLSYFSLYSYATYGLMLFIFILSVYVQITDWINTIFVNIMPTVFPNMTVFNWYLNNIIIFNTTLMIFGLLLNNINLNLFNFLNNKQKEDLINDEL